MPVKVHDLCHKNNKLCLGFTLVIIESSKISSTSFDLKHLLFHLKFYVMNLWQDYTVVAHRLSCKPNVKMEVCSWHSPLSFDEEFCHKFKRIGSIMERGKAETSNSFSQLYTQTRKYKPLDSMPVFTLLAPFSTLLKSWDLKPWCRNWWRSAEL